MRQSADAMGGAGFLLVHRSATLGRSRWREDPIQTGRCFLRRTDRANGSRLLLPYALRFQTSLLGSERDPASRESASGFRRCLPTEMMLSAKVSHQQCLAIPRRTDRARHAPAEHPAPATDLVRSEEPSDGYGERVAQSVPHNNAALKSAPCCAMIPSIRVAG